MLNYYRVDPCGGRVYLQKTADAPSCWALVFGAEHYAFMQQFLMALGLKTSFQVTYSDVLCTREAAFK